MPTGVPLTPTERALRDLEAAVAKLISTARRESALNLKLRDQLAQVKRDLR